MMRILIYTEALNRKNGGNAAMLLYAKVLASLNYNITIWVDRKHILKFYFEKYFNKVGNVKVVHNIILDDKFDVIISSAVISNETINLLSQYNARFCITHTGDFNNDNSKWYTSCREHKIEFISESKQQSQILENNKFKVTTITPPCDEYLLSNVVNKGKSDRKNLLMVGSIQYRKNQLRAVKIFHELKKSSSKFDKLFLVGNIVLDEHYKELIAYINSNKLTNYIHLTGFQKHYYKYYSLSFCCISTSRSEGFATSNREAMFLGKYIVATDIPGNVGQLDSTNSDVISDEMSNSEVAKMIIKTIEEDRVEKISVRAREKYENFYSEKVFKINLKNFIEGHVK